MVERSFDQRTSNDVKLVIAKSKDELNLYNEMKWTKVTEQYLSKYESLVNTFFDLVRDDAVKIRIMFTQNCNVPDDLNDEQRRNEYLLLYYQFLKHAFGLRYANFSSEQIRVRLYLDQLPATKSQKMQFKAFLGSLNELNDFRQAKIHITKDQIAEVSSHNHNILQCLDIVLGAIQFRLNDKHKARMVGSQRRGKRTIAKERLYKLINRRIREIYPGFNIGISTGTKGDLVNRWRHPYRHWLFEPRQSHRDPARTKQRK